MAATTSRISPSAQLLRNSRLFALPPPVQPPPPGPTNWIVHESSTATTQHPTHASIITLDTSRMRGDWGLKRPLPLRSTTNSSTPIIRVKGVDTIEHITDFESAADHTLTLRKWQELNFAVTVPQRRDVSDHIRPGPSVFEKWLDNRHNIKPSEKRFKDERRWQFEGPWLAGQNRLEFDAFINRDVRRRKPEFLAYLRTEFESAQRSNAREMARDRGLSQTQHDLDKQIDISEEAFQKYVKHLGNDPGTLGQLIATFFDLAAPPDTTAPGNFFRSADFTKTRPPASTSYAQYGPPTTHPSAGFSYHRTNSILDNHPILGPQSMPKPIKARVLQTKFKSNQPVDSRAVVGVGGIANEVGGHLGMSTRSSRERRQLAISDILHTFDPSIKGGAKLWVHPKAMTVDPNGRIHFSLQEASSEVVALHTPPAPAEPLPEVTEGRMQQVPSLVSRERRPPTSDYGLEGTVARGSEGNRENASEGGDEETISSANQSILDMLREDSRASGLGIGLGRSGKQ